MLNTLSSRTNYKDALKSGFYELQMARDWYREVTSDIGMHLDLVKYWIRVSCLLIMPIAPHFAEHIWETVLGEKGSIQLALWPEPSHPVDPAILASGAYLRGTIKTIRDAELSMLKKAGKSKTTPFDPKKPKSLRIYVASTFPQWQNVAVEIVQKSFDRERERVDDNEVKKILSAQQLMKDKRMMPFIQAFKVRLYYDFSKIGNSLR